MLQLCVLSLYMVTTSISYDSTTLGHEIEKQQSITKSLHYFDSVCYMDREITRATLNEDPPICKQTMPTFYGSLLSHTVQSINNETFEML